MTRTMHKFIPPQKKKIKDDQCHTSKGYTFIEAVPDALLIHNGKGRIIAANRHARLRLGYSHAELLNLSLQDMEITPSGTDVTDHLLAGKGPITTQATYRCKDGTTFPAEIKTDILEQADENFLFISTIRDTSARPSRQRRLQDKRDLLRAIIDSIPEIICVKDGQGRWLLANTFDQNLFGLRDVDYRGKTDIELAEYTSPIYSTAFRACRESDERAWQEKRPVRSKEIIPVTNDVSRVMDVYKIPLFHANGKRKALIVVGRDITKQHHAEQRIRESEARYRQLFQQAPVGILHFNTDLHVTDCNNYFLSLMAIKRDQLIGFDLRKIRDKKILPVFEATLRGEEDRWEGIYQTTLSNITLYVSLRTTPLCDNLRNIEGGLALFEDRSLQKQAQEEKIRLMSAIDQAAETIVITDRDGTIEYVNPAFEKITGYKFDEALGQNPRILKSGLHSKDFYKDMWQTLCAGQVWKGRLINKRKDGTLFKEDASITPVRNQSKKIINYVAVKRDVTQEVALKKQLNQAMKMEAIGTLAGGIAHDFNNILSAILGYAEMAELRLAQDDPIRQDMGQIIAAGKRASNLIRQILTFSRQEENEQLKPVKVQHSIKEVLKLLQASLPATIKLRQDIDPNCGPVLADPTRIHQILMNICTNARQAMGEKQGILTIRLAEIDGDSVITPLLHGQTRWLDLEISDNGPGMEPTVKDRIFDPFFTTKQKGVGTGLGLSVVHGIVKSHNGEITVDSEPGEGTTFHVYLPIIDDTKKDTEQEDHIVAPKGTEHILIIDDEPMLVDLIQRFLSRLGYEVTSFTDSQSALDWFTDHGEEIDLVITDMTMPHLTGAELAEKILAARPQIPIILCTGYSEVMNDAKARSIGIRKFLTKPINNRVLAQSVRELLDNEPINRHESTKLGNHNRKT